MTARIVAVALVSMSACAFDVSGLDGYDAWQADATAHDDASFDAVPTSDSLVDSLIDSTTLDVLPIDGSVACPGYYASVTPASWENARVACETDGGYLVVINNTAENSIAMGLVVGGQSHIGLSDLDLNGVFEWVNGDPLSYTNWHSGQPSGEGGVVIAADGTWYDLDASAPQSFICECDGV